MTTTDPTQEFVSQAQAGDRSALEALVKQARDPVYNLALRMLGNPANAEDVTQEVLVRVVTAIGTFRGESSFRTWVYRIATNHVLTVRRRLAEAQTRSFDELGELLDHGMESGEPPLEEQILIKEAKLRCTTAMLLSLDVDHRAAYIIGEILELSSEEGAMVLEIAEPAFRKRLSRARERMSEFMEGRCGLIDQAAPCRCAVQAAAHRRSGLLDPSRLTFACLQATSKSEEVERQLGTVETWMRAAAIFRSHPDYVAPDSLSAGLRQIIDGDKSGLLGGGSS